ncbi:MAG: sugar ABC transporter permease [Lachnospiraceae bacterium]|nr:sugar ABC transporter permease [Lachnospiraceae bacterium]
MAKKKRSKIVRYNKWGYIFLIPFIVVYLVFQFVPLVSTIWNSFYEHYFANGGILEVGPNFKGFENYKTIITNGDLLTYSSNTLIMWVLGFIPQIVVSLLLGAWFTDPSLRLKCQRFFKTVIYLPNLIMASAFAMLFFTLFSEVGPINSILLQTGILQSKFAFMDNMISVRAIVAFMNFIMWFGNTTILLMAGMMGIDVSLFEAAQVDGATATQVFFRITLPLLRPILVYVMITSLIGGLQMFDVPQILTNGTGNPGRSTMTLIMYLNRNISTSKNYGLGGALSVFLFIITGILSLIVYKFTTKKED